MNLEILHSWYIYVWELFHIIVLKITIFNRYYGLGLMHSSLLNYSNYVSRMWIENNQWKRGPFILVCFSKRPFPTQKTKKEGWDEILGSWKLRSTLQVINIYWKVAKSTVKGKNKCNPLIAPAAGAAKFRRNQMNTNLTIKL